jgi:phosphoglycerate dehydrogenase-like enzyme
LGLRVLGYRKQAPPPPLGVDEAALVRALQTGRIGGAGLDTFSREPLPANHPLWHCPNTLITPHYTPHLEDRTDRMLYIIEENFRRYRADEPLLNQLQPDDL